jgi:phytanoyl-CoA hydroxylase
MNPTIPALHPASTGFTWHDRTGPRRLLSTEQVRHFDEQGYVVLEDVIDPDTIAAVTAEIDPVEEAVEQLVRDAGGSVFIARADEITFTTHLAKQSDVLRSFVRGPLFCDLTADLIGPDVRLYWDQAVYKKPGTDDPFPWHQDNGYAFVEPQQYLTCWIALTDATEDNGCPWIVPGLHRHGTFVHRHSELGFVCLDDAAGAVPAPVRAGGMVAFSSLAPHCTGPNRTDETRKAYIVQYAPDGAEVVAGEGAEQTRTRCDDPDRQFPILVGGVPATS